MGVLLLRASGLMQSWGVQSRFGVRDTGLEPSKSGVVGLLCAALGRRRDEPIDDLAALTMGVRVDQEGTMGRDYQTASDVLKASGGIKSTETSTRTGPSPLTKTGLLKSLPPSPKTSKETLPRITSSSTPTQH